MLKLQLTKRKLNPKHFFEILYMEMPCNSAGHFFVKKTVN